MDRRTEPHVYVIDRGDATGPFTVWDPYLDAVWPPLLGSSALAAIRAVTLAITHLGAASTVEITQLAALVGVAPTRFVAAIGRAEEQQLAYVNGTQLSIPRRLHGPKASVMAELPLPSRTAAIDRLVRFAEGRLADDL